MTNRSAQRYAPVLERDASSRHILNAERPAVAAGLAELPQPAIRTDKEAAVRGFGRPLDEGLRIEAACFNTLIDGPEIREGLRQFNERDHPDRRPART